MNIGIDLGTTNSALAYVQQTSGDLSDYPEIRIFEIPQYVAPGQIEPRRTLPSFLFLGPDQNYIGAYAREQGALVPTKLVHSAKSWLSNPEVDRTAKILPWDAQEGGRVLSPVEVSGMYLGFMRDAWDKAHPEAPLSSQDIVLTVPASFDEEARELTVQAAREAGLEKLTLVEEPAAAFYSWIANHLAQSQKSLFDGMVVLVCDVGGGTSDFTLIRVNRQGDRVEFTRTAVGKHLLLGGDNLDLTLAWLVEAKLKSQLSIRQRSGLRRQCAAAKERMLADPNLKRVEITVLGGGSSLIGGTLKTEILREEALELTLEGFLPFCDLNEKPKEEKRSLFRELGLPYVSDPAITRHLAAFLTANDNAKPDAILFNGGFFIPDLCQQRVTDVLERWFGHRPAVLENRDLDLAVAVGASYYSYVRSTGAGLVVRGGLPRSYYIGIGENEAVCLIPRGAEEGSTVELDTQDLHLVANKPVSFRLYSSLSRVDDTVGQVLGQEQTADLHLHAPLDAVIRFGKQGERLVPIKLRAHLTAVGTLELWADSKISEHRWRLQFELRKQAAAKTSSRPAAVVSDEALAQAEGLIEAAFQTRSVTPEELPAKLEQAIGLGRNSWPLTTIRRLGDRMLEASEGRRKSPALESRWLNLCGLCLRPGFGFPGDDFRIEQARRIYASGLAFPNQVENEIQWWIFWGRVAGGMNKNQQADMFQRLSATLLPRAKKPQRVNTSLMREMWRTAASLELLPIQTKTQLGDALLSRARAGEMRDTSLWCLSRIGARKLFYGPINLVIPVSTATRWIEGLVRLPHSTDALVAIARHTGDSTRDVSAATLDLVRRNIPEATIPALEGEEGEDLGKIFGEELPSGLVTAGSNRVLPVPTEDSITAKLRSYSTLIGDDCAIIRPRPGEDLLFTTDFSIEDVHFTRDQLPEEIGYRALARSLSDIAAMGGAPRYCLVSLALAPWTDERWIERFYIGLMHLAQKTKTQLAGGDLSHAGQLTCDVMVCGAAPRGKALRRGGAKPGDRIYVSDVLGGWKHKPFIVPRLEIGKKLLGKATACMDISDGLALDLHRLCLESGVAAALEAVPLALDATLEEALHDGEDYELLYTAPPKVKVPGIPIGTIAKGKPGWLTLDGRPLPPKGYDHVNRS